MKSTLPRKSELEKFPLGYEFMPTDDLLKKISKRTRSAKLKAIRNGWVAQIRVRVNVDEERQEIAEIASTPREALTLLDRRMQELNLYD